MVKFVCPEGKRRQGQLCFQAPKGAADGEDGTSGASAELKALISSFRPSLTPKEVLHLGAFGGTYFRDIDSAVTGKRHKDAWKELPKSWLKGLDIRRQVARDWEDYDATVNHYGVKCGNTLEEWENAGWMHPQDPYGWFQWYCRFFQGRRSEDDPRQIKRWLKICGPTGRWKGNLIAKCVKANRAYNDPKVSPVVRQSLLHWAYELTAADLREKKKEILQGKGAYALPRAELFEVHRQGLKRPAASR
ncbi:unnamed protein product [Durusdinium trenchii]|uniref:Uncharacterized protein n=1 Tax=Durusdinium trenchii TaxID=1381693 RepID=A0ABP0LET8_9DINO